MKSKILASFCALVFTAMLTGCGTKTGNEISSDISSMLPSTDNSSQQSNDNSMQYNSDSSTQYNSDGSNNQNSYNSSDVKISKEKAKEIALKHANVKEADINDYEIELDNENGTLVYDISFDHKDKEYDYDIDAKTGEIKYSKNKARD